MYDYSLLVIVLSKQEGSSCWEKKCQCICALWITTTQSFVCKNITIARDENWTDLKSIHYVLQGPKLYVSSIWLKLNWYSVLSTSKPTTEQYCDHQLLKLWNESLEIRKIALAEEWNNVESFPLYIFSLIHSVTRFDKKVSINYIISSAVWMN
jgi:hypothetical protein